MDRPKQPVVRVQVQVGAFRRGLAKEINNVQHPAQAIELDGFIVAGTSCGFAKSTVEMSRGDLQRQAA